MSSTQTLFESLAEHGWAVNDDIIPPLWQEQLLSQSQQLWQNGHFEPAHTGRTASSGFNPGIRGDSILWLDTGSCAQNKHPFFAWADQFRQQLNERYYLGLRSDEFHFAHYAAGRSYKKHLDQHRSSQRRKISIVLYLNSQWSEQDGGELCLYSAADDTLELARILPRPARLVVFRSELIPHEVLPGQQARWSLAGWFRTDTDGE